MNLTTTIYQLIEAQSIHNPNQTAILNTENQQLTYADLFTQINYVIKQLRGFNLNRKDQVAIVLPNGVEMAITFLSVSSSTICCPLNPNYRQSEYEFYLSDLNPKALITQEGVNPDAVMVAQKLSIPVIYLTFKHDTLRLSSTLSKGGGGDQGNSEVPTRSEDLALILHTSGTTSRPKQVPLTHTNLCTSAYNISNTLKLTKNDRCLNVMPLFHIHGLIGVLLSSMSVGASVICSKGFDGEQFLTWLHKLQATWYSAVPTIHQEVLTQAKQHPENLKNLQLRLIRSSSASLPVSVMTELEKTFKVPVIEAYGMTEASHQMTSNPLPPYPRKPSSVGIPQDLEVAIMDETGKLLKPTEIGEVVIKGKNVTKGYLNNPTANEKAFTDGWFRTGDLGYLDQDGYLFLKGRIKEVINRGGEKIMPLEIDNVVMELPQVYQAVTFPVSHPTLGEDVATAVVLKPDQSITPQAIREYLFQKLADFKVPSQVIIVDKIPKGATGKLQRIGLADQLISALEGEKIAPRNEIETKIANIFQEILKLDSVSINDNFFALGGDSLKGMQIINRINAVFNLDLINVILFQKPTIAELGLEIAELKQQENDYLFRLASELEDKSS
jgi:acyl-CoA synthetase (AMP-forming)/AMP-acid ligase II/acyl carrier protein